MRIPSHLVMTGQIADQSAKRKTIATDDFFGKDNRFEIELHSVVEDLCDVEIVNEDDEG